MSEPTAANAKLWNYREDLIMFDFVSVDSKPMCIECGAILTNYSMKKVKQEHYQKSKHPLTVGKDREYCENKKKRQPVKLFIYYEIHSIMHSAFNLLVFPNSMFTPFFVCFLSMKGLCALWRNST